jgi:hypothetical protein
MNKPYEAKLPLVRKPEETERRLLKALVGLDKIMEDPEKLSPEQRAALSKLKFTVGKNPDAKSLTGEQLAQAIHQLRQLPLDPIERKSLEELRVTLASGEIVNGADIAQELELLHKSNPADSLLNSEFPVWPTGDTWIDPRFTYMLLNILAITTLWFGCNNAAKEIVKEEAIYGRERAVNLQIFPYLASKFLVLGVISVL